MQKHLQKLSAREVAEQKLLPSAQGLMSSLAGNDIPDSLNWLEEVQAAAEALQEKLNQMYDEKLDRQLEQREQEQRDLAERSQRGMDEYGSLQ